ncbi:MAG TPA: hypothetical protein VMZ53_13540 [Kofleriaceae bacterium]|nr:hypothetical protein [Kofleriaceae bacterium]
MRALAIAVLLAACGGKPDPQPPKRPNNELIVGEFERRHQEAHTAARFKADGSITIASKADELDSKAIATGTYKLDGEKLTLVYTKGDLCEAGVEGTYNVVISKVGIRFTKLDDACERRAKIDGETWYRR